nr:MAG TPA: PORTAL PROTEIN [Caudoviricetes sp.]
MLTYQDFETLRSQGIEVFIKKAIQEFQSSEFYRRGLKAHLYYKGDNDILHRLQWFYDSTGLKREDNFKANNQVPCEFYKKITKQLNSYLLANGVTVEDKIKDNLPRKFDIKIQKAGLYAILAGCSWTYCYKNNDGKFDLDVFSGIEFIPLFDEFTGQVKAGIRYFRIDENKPYNVEFYELDGITRLREEKKTGNFYIVEEKRAYITNKKVTAFSEEITGSKNFGLLPVIPFWGNDIKESSLTTALKNKIDLYDIIESDFGNNLEDSKDVYWVLKNYNGQDLGEFLADYKYYKSIKVDDDGDATPHTLEVPYQARQTALEIIKKDIYDSAMALDTSVLSGGSLTNIAIKAMMTDLDLKADDFENEALDYMDNLLLLYREITGDTTETKVNFIRRGIVNDTEIVENIVKMRNDISQRTALELNPYIEDVEEELDRIEEEARNKYTIEENSIDVNNNIPQDDTNNTEEE